jgi:dTDP-4-amino-4,6-dideoxygalactose transaminase
LRAEIEAAIREVCDEQRFVLGPRVAELEANVARYSQTKHGLGLSSGTDALLLALMALEIGPGDEVITTPYTFFATGGTVARVGARPLYCDIDPRTYNLSAASVQAFIDATCEMQGGVLVNKRTGGKVRVLMPVHLYGQVADMDAMSSIAQRYNLRVIEDAAQAIGSEDARGRRAGSLGDIGCFSFFPSKNLGAFGDAGMCSARDADLAERLRIVRVHGGKPKYYHQIIGGNFRLDELQAAVLDVKLDFLDGWTQARQRNARYYDQAFAATGLTGKIQLPFVAPGRHIFNQYVIRVPQRDALRKHLTEWGVGTEIYYPVPLHLQKCFEHLGYRQGDCPESERAANETVAIPIYPELTTGQLDYVVASIARFYG